jgi:hypothetical protein
MERSKSGVCDGDDGIPLARVSDVTAAADAILRCVEADGANSGSGQNQ